MATINGTTIEFEDISIDSDVDLAPYNILGSNENQLADNGMPGLRISLSARALSSTDYDTVMAAIMGQGQKELVITSGWTYQVFTDRKSLDHGMDNQNLYRFSVDFLTVDPYVYTTTSTTRSKTITSNGQQWSADDSTNDITTSGNVAAVPDIEVTGGAASGFNREGALLEETDATEYTQTGSTYVLNKTYTLAAQQNVQYNLQEVACDLWWEGSLTNTAYAKVTYEIAGGGEVDLVEWSETSESPVAKSYTCDISTTGNQSLVIRYYLKHVSNYTTHMQDAYHKTQEYLLASGSDVQVFNTADDDQVCDVANEVLDEEVIRINAGGTGHIDLDDDFDDDHYESTCWFFDGVTHDAIDDEIDIADGGYIIYKVDAKYPITGTPTFTSQINITSGTPTIQVSLDDDGEPGTWYDIDTAVVDDVDTIYKLISGSDVDYEGQTVLWVRFDCGGTGTVTCSVKSFELDIDIITIDALIPLINTGAANTFQCDFSGDDSVDCVVSLIYKDRKWA